MLEDILGMPLIDKLVSLLRPLTGISKEIKWISSVTCTLNLGNLYQDQRFAIKLRRGKCSLKWRAVTFPEA